MSEPTLYRIANTNSRMRQAIAEGDLVPVEPVDPNNVAYFIHLAMRKGIDPDAKGAHEAWVSIRDMDDEAWGNAVKVGLEWAKVAGIGGDDE